LEWFGLKDVELRLIAELMKNSRRSDRELAKALKVSQPTVSRMIRKLEREGVIREYTMIPDFSKLGYQIMGLTFVKRSEEHSEEKTAETREAMAETERQNPHAYLMVVTGIGLGRDRLFAAFYEDYSDYSRVMSLTRRIPNLEAKEAESFLVDLNDKNNYKPLSMAAISNHILLQAEKTGKTSRRKRSTTPSKNTKK